MNIGYTKEKRKKEMLVALASAAIVAALLGNILHTQLVAHAFGYSDSLGAPVIGKIYWPWEGIVWQWKAGAVYPELFRKNLQISLSGAFGCMMAIMLFIVAYNPVTKGNKTLYGTARFASYKDVVSTGLLNPLNGNKTGEFSKNATVVGGFQRGSLIEYLYHKGPEHILAFAPSRSGKGVSLMLPTLFTWLESVVVLDIKGEAWALTSGWRKNYSGSNVMKFDPTDDSGCGVRYNPLAEIRINTNHDVADVQNIVTLIVDPDGKGLEDHWQKTSHSLLTGVILHMVYQRQDQDEEHPSLADIVHALSDPANPPEQLFVQMIESTHYQNMAHPVAAAAAQDMLNKADRERSSVLSTAISYLALYRDPVLAANIAKSDFQVTDLMQSSKPVSLYLVLRPKDKERLMPLIRLIVAQLTTKLTADMAFENGEAVAHYKHRLLLLLDEFTALRKMELLEQQLPFLAGYGIKCYFIVQDLKQLYRFYTENESITPNCHIRIAFAANEVKTAQYLSQATGETTVVKQQISASGGRMSTLLGKVSKHYSEVKRPLLTPDEITRLPLPKKDSEGRILEPGKMLIFVAGQPVILGVQPLYFMDVSFSARSKIEPPLASDHIGRC